MNNKKLIEETFKFISEFNPEHFTYSESVLIDCADDCQPDMKDFAETVKKFMENLCNDEDK